MRRDRCENCLNRNNLRYYAPPFVTLCDACAYDPRRDDVDGGSVEVPEAGQPGKPEQTSASSLSEVSQEATETGS